MQLWLHLSKAATLILIFSPYSFIGVIGRFQVIDAPLHCNTF